MCDCSGIFFAFQLPISAVGYLRTDILINGISPGKDTAGCGFAIHLLLSCKISVIIIITR